MADLLYEIGTGMELVGTRTISYPEPLLSYAHARACAVRNRRLWVRDWDSDRRNLHACAILRSFQDGGTECLQRPTFPGNLNAFCCFLSSLIPLFNCRITLFSMCRFVLVLRVLVCRVHGRNLNDF